MPQHRPRFLKHKLEVSSRSTGCPANHPLNGWGYQTAKYPLKAASPLLTRGHGARNKYQEKLCIDEAVDDEMQLMVLISVWIHLGQSVESNPNLSTSLSCKCDTSCKLLSWTTCETNAGEVTGSCPREICINEASPVVSKASIPSQCGVFS